MPSYTVLGCEVLQPILDGLCYTTNHLIKFQTVGT